MDIKLVNASYLQYDRIPVANARRKDSNKSIVRMVGSRRNNKGLTLMLYDVQIPYGIKSSNNNSISIDIALPSNLEQSIQALKLLDSQFKIYIQSQLPEAHQLNYHSLFHHDIITARVNKNKYGRTNLEVRDAAGKSTGLYASNSTQFVNATITLHYLWWSRDLAHPNQFIGGVFTTLDKLALIKKTDDPPQSGSRSIPNPVCL